MAGMASMNSLTMSSLNTPSGLPKFVSRLAEKNLCIKCHELLRNAMQTSCGHRLCERCVHRMFDGLPPGTSIKCPANEEDCENQNSGSFYPDASARRDILKLSVYCPHQPYGCKAQVKWKELQAHVSSCEYVPVECNYRRYGCQEMVPKMKIRQHETEDCLYRLVSCRTCGEMFPKNDVEDHEQKECPKAIISCPHNCGMSPFPRAELEAHYNSCPSRPVKCPFADYGCVHEGSQQSVEVHCRENMEGHMKMLVEGISKKDLTINELRMKVADLENDIDIWKARTTENERLMKGTNEKVDHNKSMITKLQNVIKNQNDKIEKLEKKGGAAVNLEQLDRQAANILTMQETLKFQEQKVARIEREGAGTVNIDPIKAQVSNHDKQLGIYDVRLAEVDLRFQVLETASFDGVLIWKIRDYARRKQEAVDGKTYSLYSQPFYTSRYGYKMCARVYLNGDGMGKNTHMSLFFVMMRGECDALLQWPFKQKVTLMLIDQESGRSNLSDTFRPDPTSSSFKRPTTNMNIASGCPMFVSQSVLHNGKYIKEDTLFIKVIVDTSDLYGP